MTDLQDEPRPTMTLVLRALAENVAVARQVCGGIAAAAGMDEPAVADLRLAVSEACTNVVLHAYDESEAGLMEIGARVDEALLHVAVRDGGRGISGQSPTSGLGLGIPIVEAVTESMEIEERRTDTNGPAGNDVRMTFVIS